MYATRLELERLEDRLLLSGGSSDFHVGYRVYMPVDQPYQTPGPTGFTPQQVEKAYGIDQLYGNIGNGSGQTIAIVDAYDDPNLLNSSDSNFNSSDLHQFDAAFGLPDPPNFVKLNQTGGTSLPTTDPAGPGPGAWEGEEALDVEWAHSIAPGANLILFEANSASPSDLYAAVATAANYPGVSVVSMSFGGPESSTDPSNNGLFTTPAGHQGVTFVTGSGDDGSFGSTTSTTAQVDYPAASPNVLAVGGTNLVLNSDNSYKSETAWGNGANSATQGGSGGGVSVYESEPSYQQSVQKSGSLEVPDVAFLADPATGVSVYDSYDNGAATPWDVIGGTSLACPSWAGLIAITDEGLAQVGLPTLDGPSQTIPDLYAIYKSNPNYFHDITSGSNGAFTAGPGYDEVTGMGSPVANVLIPALVGNQTHHLFVQNTLSAATEGIPLNNVAVANFQDLTGSQPVSDYAVTISWGDGAITSGAVVADGGDNYTVQGSHTYLNTGTYTLTVTVRNASLGFGNSNTSKVNVGAAPLIGSAQVVNGVTANFLTNKLVAVFSDTDTTPRPASDFSATIQWNEGSGLVFNTTGTIFNISGNTFSVYGSSPYSLPYGGLFPLLVTVHNNENGASVTVHSTLNVANNLSVSTLNPQYQSDVNSTSALYFDMEDALVNLLGAENLFMLALGFGTMKEKSGTFGNLVNALLAYENSVLHYDVSLPGT